MLQTEHLFLIFLCLLIVILLIAMLLPIHFSTTTSPKKNTEKPKGHCPICKHALYSGEKVRSNQEEIGNIEVRTRIKGCIYCIDLKNQLRRQCPICEKNISIGEFVLAISDPRTNRLKLSIKGCRQCFPQGF